MSGGFPGKKKNLQTAQAIIKNLTRLLPVLSVKNEFSLWLSKRCTKGYILDVLLLNALSNMA